MLVFMMNSQEIETALRYKIPIVILIWNDSSYGLIEWKQRKAYGRISHVKFITLILSLMQNLLVQKVIVLKKPKSFCH